MKPQIVQRSMIDIPSSREQRFEEPYRREKSDVSVRSSVPAARPPKSREVPHVRGRGRVDLEKLVDGSIGDILRNRRENLVSACESWPDVESVLDNTIALEDETVLIDILNVINRRINVWNLSMCHKLLSEIKPSLLSLIMSKEESTLETVLDGLCLIGRHFGNIILENLQQAPGALDIQASERYERALTCSNGLRQASSILKSRQATFPPSISSKVRSAIMELKVF